MEDSQIEELINQTINGTVLSIPDYLNEIKENQMELKIESPKEFVYGLIMGMSLGMASAFLTTQSGIPSPEDQLKIRDLVYKKMSSVREKIYE